MAGKLGPGLKWCPEGADSRRMGRNGGFRHRWSALTRPRRLVVGGLVVLTGLVAVGSVAGSDPKPPEPVVWRDYVAP